MKRLQYMTMVFWCWVILVIPGLSLATLNEPLTMIELENSVHFLAADGSDIEISPGTYTVESAEKWILLVPGERRDALLIEADHRTHSLDINDPLAMAIPGDSNEEADLHYVLLLLPGGQSLEATGTYSGIRPRGFNVGQALNNAKKTATNTYNQAKSTTNNAGSAATNAAQQAALQGQQAAQQAFAFSQESDAPVPASSDEIQSRGLSIGGCEIKYKNALPDFDNLKTCINGKMSKIQDDAKKATDAAKAQAQGVQSELNNLKNSPFLAKLDGERRMLEAVRTLNLEPFFACLSQNQSLQPQFTSRIQLLASNPGKFAADIANEISSIAQQRAQALMAEHLQVLRTSGGPGDRNQVADRSIRIFTQLANEHPVTRCILPRVNPQIAMIKQASLQIAPQMETRLKQTFDQVFTPVLYETVGKAMGAMLKNLTNVAISGIGKGIQFLTPDEITTVANGIAFEHIFTKDFAEARAYVDQVASAAGSPATSQASLTRLRQVVTRQDVIPEVLRFEVGHAILRFAGHKFIECSLPGCGGEVVMQMLGGSELLKNVVVEVISAVCSLADIAGGGVCGVGETVTPNGIYDTIALPAIHKGAITGLHAAFDGVMNLHRDAILKGLDPRTRRQPSDPLMALVDLLPTKEVVVFFADSQVRNMHTAFKSYNASVLRLAEAANRR